MVENQNHRLDQRSSLNVLETISSVQPAQSYEMHILLLVYSGDTKKIIKTWVILKTPKNLISNLVIKNTILFLIFQ
jgi:hypothetical protein